MAGRVTVVSGDDVDALPRSTVSTILRGDRMPRAEFVDAFVDACLAYRGWPRHEIEPVVEKWIAVWRQLSAIGLGAAVDVPAEAGAGAAIAVPRQLPLDSGALHGREADLAALSSLAEGRDARLVLVSGTVGVGKTALAVRWAREHADRYPDGQLHLDLRGSRPGRAMTSEEALGEQLRVLGADVPAGFEAKRDLYRALLADRRVLVVLDDAADAQQVRPLLAGGERCLTIVTSRSRVPALVARDGARRLLLSPLAAGDAFEVLAGIVGRDRLRGAEYDVEQLADACGGLPLALRIAAVKIADHPRWSIADCVGEFRRIGTMAFLSLDGEEEMSMRAALDASYQVLEPEVQHLLRRIGRWDHPEITVEAGAALIGASRADTWELLCRLVRHNLIEAAGVDRFTIGPVVRAHAEELSELDGLRLDGGFRVMTSAQ